MEWEACVAVVQAHILRSAVEKLSVVVPPFMCKMAAIDAYIGCCHLGPVLG